MADSIMTDPVHPVASPMQDALRPQFHFLPPRNWMNDPNGWIQWDGRYHLFYQHNPNGAYHANMHWGHAVSDDLLHWEHLPMALIPTPGGYDKDGVFSGCMVDNQGVPTIVYTGILPEVQCLATGSSDLLTWKKYAAPVIAAPPSGLELFGFRDPCVFHYDGQWCMTLGAGIKNQGGAVLLYTSPDLIQWTYTGPLLVDDSGLTNKVWECPAFFPLGDKWVLIVSVTARENVDYFIGTFDGQRFHPEVRRTLDYGRYFYAPQTLLDDQGRRVMIGWIWEGRSEILDIAAGWSGIQSLPRILTLRPGNWLGIEPTPEMQRLRKTHQPYENLTLRAGMPYSTTVRGNQLEYRLSWQPDDAVEVGVTLAQSPDGEEQTQITYNRVHGELRVDRRLSNAAGNVHLDTQSAPVSLEPGEALGLHIFFDRSVIEIFANDRVCLTSRIYPTRGDSQGVSFFASGCDTHIEVDIWELESIWW